MPATTLKRPDARDDSAEAVVSTAAAEVFLTPRVVDERAFRAFSARLQDLAGQADVTRASLESVSGRGGELLASLEALIHTQTNRAKEIRTTLTEVETRIKNLDAQREKATTEADRIAGFEKRSAEQLASLSEASIAVVERAETAQQALVDSVERARAEATSLHAETMAIATPKLDTLDERLTKLDALVARAEAREQELKPLIESSQNAAATVRETAKQLDGLRQQSEQLLSVMRSTILESAEARDAADSRLDRLGTLGKNAGTVLETLTQQVKRAEQRAAKIAPAEIDLDPIVRVVAERVMKAMESRFETALAKNSPEAAPTDERMGETLREIQASLEMLSGVTLKLASEPKVETVREILPVPSMEPSRAEPAFVMTTAHETVTEPTPPRARRAVVLPVSAEGEFGKPGGAVALWSWTEGQA